MNVFMFVDILDADGSLKEVVLFKPYWLAYSHKVYEMLGDYGMFSPILFCLRMCNLIKPLKRWKNTTGVIIK